MTGKVTQIAALVTASSAGTVSRDMVIYVLGAVFSGNCDISFQADGATITLVKAGLPEVIDLPDQVPRRMLQRLSNKYDVKIEYFFHPTMLSKSTNTLPH